MAERTAEQSEEDEEPNTRAEATSPTSLLSSQGTETGTGMLCEAWLTRTKPSELQTSNMLTCLDFRAGMSLHHKQ